MDESIIKQLHERLMRDAKLSSEEQQTLSSATWYWRQRTSYERLRALEMLRRMIWGYDDSLRIQKVFEVVSDGRSEMRVVEIERGEWERL